MIDCRTQGIKSGKMGAGVRGGWIEGVRVK